MLGTCTIAYLGMAGGTRMPCQTCLKGHAHHGAWWGSKHTRRACCIIHVLTSYIHVGVAFSAHRMAALAKLQFGVLTLNPSTSGMLSSKLLHMSSTFGMAAGRTMCSSGYITRSSGGGRSQHSANDANWRLLIRQHALHWSLRNLQPPFSEVCLFGLPR